MATTNNLTTEYSIKSICFLLSIIDFDNNRSGKFSCDSSVRLTRIELHNFPGINSRRFFSEEANHGIFIPGM